MNNILSYEQVLLEQREKGPNDMLFGATVYNNYENALKALDAGADPNYIAPKSGNTAIAQAVKSGNLDLVKLMLDRGADVDLTHKEIGYKMTPLMFATQNGDIDMVKLLLDHGANPNAKSVSNISALAYAVEKHKTHDHDIRLLELLLDAGADPTAPLSRFSALTFDVVDYAAEQGNIKAIETIFTRSRNSMLRFKDEEKLTRFFKQMGYEVPDSVLERWRKISRGKNMFGV